MDNTNNKPKNNLFLVVVITLILGITIGFGGYYIYSSLSNKQKETVDTVDKEDNNEIIDKDTENTINNSSVGKVEFYSADKYTLTLVTHYDVESTTTKGTFVSDINTFILDINEYYSGHSATGSYYIDGNTMYLTFSGGCGSETNFYCPLPEGATVYSRNQLQVTISDDGINLGNLKLIKDVQ